MREDRRNGKKGVEDRFGELIGRWEGGDKGLRWGKGERKEGLNRRGRMGRGFDGLRGYVGDLGVERENVGGWDSEQRKKRWKRSSSVAVAVAVEREKGFHCERTKGGCQQSERGEKTVEKRP